MKVAIIMGSDSDWPVLKVAAETLSDFGIEFEVLVASAHRTPDIVHTFISGAKDRNVGVVIAAAGVAAHLPGVVAATTTLPVIGVPMGGGPLNGFDALLSIAQMPPGIPVGCMAINGAKNAALFAVEILAVKDKNLDAELVKFRARMRDEVVAKSQNLQKTLVKQ